MNTLDPFIELMRLINGYQVSQALHVAALLGIADELKEGPKPFDTVAKACGAHPTSVYRLLRALAAVGVFHENDNKEFSLTPVGLCLTSDAVASRRNWARYIGGPGHWHVWGNLLHSIKTGEAAYVITHGMDPWSYRKNNADEQVSFDDAMTVNSRSQAHAVLEAYDFSKFGCIVDVGGGQGLLLKEVLLACPASSGVLFDQPQVVATSSKVLSSPELVQRCKVIAGNILESVPGGGDAYIMKFILHDWDDQRSISILRACRRAMLPTATLIVIERIIDPPNQTPEGKFSDLNMLISHGALERTREEFNDLFQKGGFELTEVIATRSPLSIVLGKPSVAV